MVAPATDTLLETATFCITLTPKTKFWPIEDLPLVLPPASKGKAQVTSTGWLPLKRWRMCDVERVIQRVKNFHILCNVLPITLANIANDILTIRCGISNLQGPLGQHWIDPAFKF